MTIDQFTNSNAPITILVNVGNPLAVRLAHILVEQGSHLLLVDKMTSAKKKLLGDLLTRQDCLFMDAESTFRNIEKFRKIDYVYYFINHLVTGTTYPEHFAERMETVALSHKEFIKESNRVDAYLKLAIEFNAAVTLVSSATVAQFLEHPAESNLQLQKYAESLVNDYVERSKLNGRIVRVGELIGPDYDLASPTNLARLIREVLLRDKVNIFGDGLQQNYVVSTEDAVYGILKAAFSDKAIGMTYLVAYPHPLTSLSIAYQLLELTVEEKEVVFNEVLPRHDDIAKLKDMCLAPSVTALGWEPQIPLDQALSETMAAFSKELHQPWQQVTKPATVAVSRKSGVQEEPTAPGEKPVKLPKPVRTIKTPVPQQPDFIDNFMIRPFLAFLSIPEAMVSSFMKTVSKARNLIFSWVIALLVIGVVGIIATPYVHFGVYTIKLYFLERAIKQDLSSFTATNMNSYSTQLTTLSNGMLADYNQVSYLGNIPGIQSTYKECGAALQGLSAYAQSASISLSAGAPALQIVHGLTQVRPNTPAGKTPVDYYTEIGQIMQNKTAIMQAAQDANVGKLQLASVNTNAFMPPMRSLFQSLQSQLDEYTTMVNKTAEFYDLIPYLLGYKERRNYFIMVQNETELRATGGWFTNYALVGLENGSVRELTVNDVYNIDGKLTNVKPPADMQKGLGVKDYKLSLSNWNPELSAVSDDVASLMQKAGIFNPNDITVTMDFRVIQQLLQIVGPVQTTDLGEVTADNLYDKVGLLHSNFTPGSQAKTTVISQFMPQLINAISISSLEKKQQMLTMLATAIQHRDIMIYAKDVQIRERLLEANNTYTKLLPASTPVMAVDWNWGGNKANKFVQRITEVTINEQTQRASIKMSYTNQSKTDAYPEGTYVNVQRVYYPQQWTFLTSTGYVSAPTLYQTSSAVPYLLSQFSVPKQSVKDVTATFVIKSAVASLTLMKQAGEGPEVVRVSVTPAATNSSISLDKLREQGYTQSGETWTKSYVRDSDIVVELQ